MLYLDTRMMPVSMVFHVGFSAELLPTLLTKKGFQFEMDGIHMLVDVALLPGLEAVRAAVDFVVAGRAFIWR